MTTKKKTSKKDKGKQLNLPKSPAAKKASGKKQPPKMTSREIIVKYCDVGKKPNQLGNVLIFGRHEYRINKTLAEHTETECDKVLKNMKATLGLSAYIKDCDKKKGAVAKRKAKKEESVELHPCECGCGAITRRGSKFLPGHDMKLKSSLRKKAAAGNAKVRAKAQKELARRGWDGKKK